MEGGGGGRGHSEERDSGERPGLDPRREMLNRRYQSLNRSFRTAHHRRGHTHQDVPGNLAPVESVGAISYVPTESSETSREEERRRRGKKDKNKSSTPSRGWFTFGRKSTRSMTQHAESASSISSSTIEVTTPSTTTLDIFAPLSPPPSLAELGIGASVDPPSLETQESTASTSSSQRAASTTEANGTINQELESTLTGPDALVAIIDETHPQPESQPRPPGEQRASTDIDQAAAAAILQQQRRRVRASHTSQHSGDTDDETNEGMSPRNSIVVSPPQPSETTPPTRSDETQADQSQASTVAVPQAPPTGKEQQGEKKRSRKKGGVKVASPIKFTDALKNSPALKFITRPDLYSFLSSAGVRYDNTLCVYDNHIPHTHTHTHTHTCVHRDTQFTNTCMYMDTYNNHSTHTHTHLYYHTYTQACMHTYCSYVYMYYI